MSHETANQTPTLTVPQVVSNSAVSIGMGVFLMFMGALSFPLPWTPVPFSMMPFALLVTGVVQRPAWSVLSVGIYLVAGGLGAGVFAGGESGFQHFFGATAGYLFAFMLAAPFVSAYVQRPRRTMTGAWRGAVLGLLGASATAGVVAIAWLSARGEGFVDLDSDAAGFGTGRSVAWIAIFLVVSITAGAWFLRGRLEGRRAQSVQLFLVMMAAIVMLHAIGVTVLWLASPLGFMAAIIVGSIVFLPFDILKAGLAVALTLPFLPATDSEENHA